MEGGLVIVVLLQQCHLFVTNWSIYPTSCHLLIYNNGVVYVFMCVCLAINHVKTTELIGWFLYRDGQSIRMKHGRIPVLIFYSVSSWGPYSVITTQFSKRFNPWYKENGIKNLRTFFGKFIKFWMVKFYESIINNYI